MEEPFLVSDAVRVEAFEAAEATPTPTPEATATPEPIPVLMYTITYVLGGGENSANNPAQFAKGESISLENPTRKGYDFAGWYMDARFKKKFTSAADGSITVYAKWTAAQYTVTFDGNGADNTAAYAQNHTYAKSARLTANKYSRSGYVFTGWNTAPDGSGTAYADKAYVKNLDAGTVLFAQWKPVTYTVTYALGKGINAPENPKTYTTLDEIPLFAPQCKGSTFGGWYTDAKFKKTIEGIVPGMFGNIKIYAKWMVNKYTVLFDDNMESNAAPYAQTYSYGTAAKLASNKYSRPGYVFTGWNTEPDGSGTRYLNMHSIKNLCEEDGASVTLYAQWSILRYGISYVLNGGTNSAENPASYTVEDEIVLAAPTKKGAQFVGWFINDKGSAVTVLPYGSTGKKSLYARWRPDRCTFVFMGNGADNGESYAQELIYGTKASLTDNKYVRYMYTFTGWSTEPDGSGTLFTNKQNLKGFDVEDGAVITLYAQWKPNIKTMMFNGVEFNTVNTAVDAVEMAELTYHKNCQLPDGYPAGSFHGYCLSFAYYHSACMVKGVTDLSLKDGTRHKTFGCSFKYEATSNCDTMMKRLYTLLNTGKPQIIMVKATNQRSRHFVTVVGYKSSVKSGDDLKPEDLLILDTHDGQLESMDPAVFTDNTRLIHKQNGKYKMYTMR